jgi:hypothetical protein
MAGEALSQADAILERLVRLAGLPGWKAWAWHAAKEFEQINPYDLAGMQEKLKQRMQQQKEQQQ